MKVIQGLSHSGTGPFCVPNIFDNLKM